MKKIISYSIIFVLISLTFSITILSISGIETNRFNNFISQKINQSNNNFNLRLKTIRFKFDLKQISLFLETKKPIINYRDVAIPVNNIKVYIDFFSLIKSKTKISKINVSLDKIDLKQLKKLSTNFKPSNLTSFINNNLFSGMINSEIEIYPESNSLLDNFIARGSVSDLGAEIVDNLKLEKTSFSFFADRSDILLKKIFSNTGPIKIIDGNLKLKLDPEISLVSNFQTKINYNNKSSKKINLFKDFKYYKNIQNLEADLDNNVMINFDETYKIKKYEFKNKGKISNLDMNLENEIKNSFFKKKLAYFSLKNSEIKLNFDSKKKT